MATGWLGLHGSVQNLALVMGLGGAAVAFSTAANATAFNVNCTTGGKIQPIIDSATPGDFLDIALTGVCAENVSVYSNMFVQITGKTGAGITQLDPAKPLLRINGHAWLIKLNLSSTQVTNELIQVSDMADAWIAGSKITDTQAGQLIHVFNNSNLGITNDIVSGGTDAAIEVSEGGNLQVTADSNSPGTAATIVTGVTGGNVIGCEGGSARVATDGAAGSVTLKRGDHGIYARDCNVNVRSNSGPVNITLTRSAGIRQRGGNVSLVGATITGNIGTGVEVNYGGMEITGSTIGSNGSGSVAKSGGTIAFNNLNGINTLTDAPPFTCYQNGLLYVDQIAGVITPTPAASNCLVVGGAIKH